MRKWLLSWKNVKLRFLNILKFSLFHFSDLSVCFSANLQQLGDGISLKCLLWYILPYPGNNSTSTKWVLYLWNATYMQTRLFCLPSEWTACKTVNPPEAIWNLVTSVATPQSVRPGFFNPSGHTMVCQTGIFSNTFCTPTSKAIPRSHRWGFFNASGHTTVCQTVFFPIF